MLVATGADVVASTVDEDVRIYNVCFLSSGVDGNAGS